MAWTYQAVTTPTASSSRLIAAVGAIMRRVSRAFIVPSASGRRLAGTSEGPDMLSTSIRRPLSRAAGGWQMSAVGPSGALGAEQVALATAGQDQGPGGPAVDLLAQVADVDVDHVGRDAAVLAVELLMDQ